MRAKACSAASATVRWSGGRRSPARFAWRMRCGRSSVRSKRAGPKGRRVRRPDRAVDRPADREAQPCAAPENAPSATSEHQVDIKKREEYQAASPTVTAACSPPDSSPFRPWTTERTSVINRSRINRTPTPQEMAAPSATKESQRRRRDDISAGNIRVDVGLLDKLMNLVGELVLAQPDPPARQLARGCRAAGDFSAAEPDHHRAARRGDEDPDAADRQCLEQVPPDRPRPGTGLRQAGPGRAGGERDRARPDDHRGDQGPADPPGAELRGPRHRTPRGAASPRQAGRGMPAAPAFHESGQVNIEISDDGAGIDLERITTPRGGAGADQPRAGRPHGRPRPDAVDLPARLQHRRDGHQRLGPGRGHGRRQDQHREDRRHDRHPEPARARDDRQDQDPADPGDHPRLDRHRRRRTVCHPPGQPAGAGASSRASRRDGGSR